MQFSTLALAVLSISSAFATDVTVHVVTVGSHNGSLTYHPNNVKAAVGDMVQFQFSLNNHTVTQSTFDAPCQPIALHSNVTGIYSGFMPVKAGDTNIPTYTVKISNATPIWLYCSQGKHCQNGMVMVINENTAANATRSLNNYAAGAKLAPANLVPGAAPASSSTAIVAATSSAAIETSTLAAAPIATASGSASVVAGGAGAATATSSGGTVLSTGAAGRVSAGDSVRAGSVLALLAALLL